MVKKIRKKRGYLRDFQNRDRTISIGIIGAVPGSGVTTMALSIANYLSGINKENVAVYEYGSKRTFMRMNDYLGEDLIVKHNGCTYYPKGTISLSSLYNENYPVVVVDFGTERIGLGEFARCTYKVVMVSLEPWNLNIYAEFDNMVEDIAGSDTWLWIVNGDKKTVNRHRKESSLHMLKRPFIDNPFIIDTGLIEFFEALF